MSVTRQEQLCELGTVHLLGNPGRERVEFTDGLGRTCVLRQKVDSDCLVLQVGDSYAVLPKHLQRSLVLTLGRHLDSGTFVDGGDEL